ncbi:related to syntaxin 18 [Cephalotrichum gorgonifer]|uniref:Related to syntaxin 18 n=1 Tax=Cephalotrichum gorgonifer TaxID=2041049 RepID=A0AAE8N1K9_9PEZI|nr:related to syntaxin 18 [Cephalotrichum gorgonifer]
MDLTSTFNDLLRKRDVPAVHGKFSSDELEEFLKEAYRINSHISNLHSELKDVRQAYLSTAQPRKTHLRTGQAQRYLTDRDREDIDANAKQIIREINASIRILDDSEHRRRDDEEAAIRRKYAGGLGALGSWAAGGKKTEEHKAAEARALDIGIHRDGVLWLLRKKLELCCATQQSMMEARLTREMERNRSVLANATVPLPGYNPTQSAAAYAMGVPEKSTHAEGVPTSEQHGSYAPDSNLTQEQVQMFEKGNQDMMTHYQETLDKVRTAEQSLIEIAELQTVLANNLSVQSAHIDQLVADSENMVENVGSGNKELKRATKRPSTARYTFFAAGGLCMFLVLWDLVI